MRQGQAGGGERRQGQREASGMTQPGVWGGATGYESKCCSGHSKCEVPRRVLSVGRGITSWLKEGAEESSGI